MRTILLAFALALFLTAPASAKLLTADLIREPQALLPYCSWLPDPEGRQTIDSVTSGTLQERFAPLPGGVPIKGEGPVWIRLVLYKSSLSGNSSVPLSGSSRLVVNFGKLPPGRTTLFFSQSPGPVEAPGVWHSEEVRSNEEVLLPEPGLLPVSIYIHMDEMPGLWFTPVVSPQHAMRPAVLPSELILPGIIIAAAISCLLRALADRAQWALWSTLFLCCVLAQAVLPLPPSSGGFSPQDLPALLAPGMALVLLPHIGRCMFKTNEGSFLQDGILYLCSLLGAAVALAPLAPGMEWLTRLFPLWPLLLIPLIPLCLGALANKRPGSLAFTGACLMPVLGAGVTLYALEYPTLHPLAAQGSLWGLAIGGLGLALARIPRLSAHERPDADDPSLAGLALAELAAGAAKAQAADSGLRLAETPAFTQRSQYDELPPLEVSPLPEGQGQAPDALLSIDISDLRPLPDPVDAEERPKNPVQREAFAGEEEHGDAAPLQVMVLKPEETPPPDGEDNEISSPAAETEKTAETTPAGGEEHTAEEDAEADESPDSRDPLAPAHGENPEPEATPSTLAFVQGEPFADFPDTLSGPIESWPEAALAQEEEVPGALSGNETTTPVISPEEGSSRTDISDGSGALAPLPEDGRETSEPDDSHDISAAPEETALSFEPAGETRDEETAIAPEPGRNMFPETPPMEDIAQNALARQDEETAEPAAPSDADMTSEIATSASEIISLVDDGLPGQELSRAFPLSLAFMEELEDEPVRHASLPTEKGFVFSLHSLVREVHDIVAPLAKARGLLFSWYIAPSLPNLLEGDAPSLRGALSLLLQNAVQATPQGAVQLSVRKNPGSGTPADLLIAISDGGSAQRTDAGFFHAWELAARTGGVFTLESSSSGGTQISFTVHFEEPSEESVREYMTRYPEGTPGTARLDDDDEPMPVLQTISAPAASAAREEGQDSAADAASLAEAAWLAAVTPEQELSNQSLLAPAAERTSAASAMPSADDERGAALPEAEPRERATAEGDTVVKILAADMTTSNRRLLAHYLADLPYEHLNADNAGVLAVARQTPVSLVIFDADMPEPDIIKTISKLRKEETGRGSAPVPVLVFTSHDAQSERMLTAGASHVLVKPFPQSALREKVLQAVPLFAQPESLPPPSPALTPEASEPEKSTTVDSDGLSSPNAGQALAQPAPPPGPAFGAEATEGEDTPTESAAPASAGRPKQTVEPPQQEVDLLEAALRDAPTARGSSVEVKLPPRYGLETARAASEHLPPTEADNRTPQQPDIGDPAAAAPILLGLSPEDVTPQEPSPPQPEAESPASVQEASAPGSSSPPDKTRPPSSSKLSIRVSSRPGRLAAVKEGGNAPKAAIAPPAPDKESGIDIRPDETTDAEVPAASSLLDLILPEEASAQDASVAEDAVQDKETPPLETKATEESREPEINGPSPETPAADAVQAEERPEPPADAEGEMELPVAAAPFTNGGPDNGIAAPDAAAPVEDYPREPTAYEDSPEPQASGSMQEPEEQEAAPEAGSERGTPEEQRQEHEIAVEQPEASLQQEEQPDAAEIGSAASARDTAAFFPLPGIEGEALDASVLPLTPGIVFALKDALRDVLEGNERGQSILVQEAAGRLAAKAENYGLQKLGKIARCVERAAEADDMEAVGTLIEDLDPVTKRYLHALQECFQAFINLDR